MTDISHLAVGILRQLLPPPAVPAVGPRLPAAPDAGVGVCAHVCERACAHGIQEICPPSVNEPENQTLDYFDVKLVQDLL